MAIAIALPVVKPGAGATEFQVVPSEVKTLPEVPGALNCTADVPLPNTTLLTVKVFAPVPPLATGKVPVTPVVSGRPVALVRPIAPDGVPEAFVKSIADGVPRLGVVSTGLVENTTLPVPVSLDRTAANSADVVEANWRRLPFLISLIATTKLPCAVVARLVKTPRVTLMLEKLLSTSKLVRGDPFAVEPGLAIEPASLRIIVAI